MRRPSLGSFVGLALLLGIRGKRSGVWHVIVLIGVLCVAYVVCMEVELAYTLAELEAEYPAEEGYVISFWEVEDPPDPPDPPPPPGG